MMSHPMKSRPVRAGGPESVAGSDESHGAEHGFSIRCHKCDTSSSGDRKFCGRCGALLWEPCVTCGTKNPTGETYCGGCGSQLEPALAALRDKLQSGLANAAALCDAGQLDQAVAVLEKLPVLAHSLLAPLNEQRQRMMDGLPAERERLAQESAAALAAARQYAEGFDFDRTERALQAVPPALRSHEAEQLLESVQQRNRAIAALEQEIRREVKTRQTHALLGKVQRLLELKPDHRDGLKLAEQLQAARRRKQEQRAVQLFQTAKQYLAQQQYAAAVEQLASIAEGVRTAEMQKLYDQAREVAWMVESLRTAPVVDEVLKAIADRLVKMIPHDGQTAQLRQALHQQLKANDAKPDSVSPVWAKPPERTLLGVPIDWATGFRRLELAGDWSSAQQSAGRFAVAVGLALQGLGLAPQQVNLLPAEKQGLLGKLTPRLHKRDGKTAWGLDLSPTGLKAVKLTLGAAGSATVEAMELIEHEKPLTRPEAENERPALVEQTLRRLLDKHDLGRSKICVGFSGVRVLGRFLKMPPIEAAKLPDAMAYEVRHQIPIAADELIWGYHLLSPATDSKKKKPPAPAQEHGQPNPAMRAVLVAAKRMQVKEHLLAFQQAGLTVDLLQSDCLALQSFLHYEFPQSAPEDTDQPRKALAMVDIGSDSTNVVIAGRGALWFRSFGRGGDAFSGALMRRFRLTHARAEQLKKNFGGAPRLSEVDAALVPVFAEFASELQRSLTAFQNEHPGTEIERMLLCGGGLLMHGLYRYLQTGK